MKYTAEFSDLKNQQYKIEFETKTGSATKELVLADSPFVTEMNSEEDILYSPMRTQGATVSIVTDIMPFDFYSGKAKGVKVSLTNTT